MANCMTCRHNDKKAKYCPIKKAHTDLGYVLNCVTWAPTDEYTINRLRTENYRLRKLVIDFDKCLDTAMYLADANGFATMPDQKLFDSLYPRMRDLKIKADE